MSYYLNLFSLFLHLILLLFFVFQNHILIFFNSKLSYFVKRFYWISYIKVAVPLEF